MADYINAIERVANRAVSPELRASLGRDVMLGDIFTDIIINDTVVRKIDEWIEARKDSVNEFGDPAGTSYPHGTPSLDDKGNLIFVDMHGKPLENPKEDGIFLNRYVYFMFKHPDLAESWGVSNEQLKTLSILEQPQELYISRSESGRYRRVLYATDADVDYIMSRGILQERIYYQKDLLSMQMKLLKTPGDPMIEEYPGYDPDKVGEILERIVHEVDTQQTIEPLLSRRNEINSAL
jgi:hypothetical protein